MRRMYSEQELTRIIGEVFDQKLESGALDSSISDAVDAYLVEHPVDITALEGQTIAPATVNATTKLSAPTLEASTSIKALEKLVDVGGNFRFFDGDGTPASIEGITSVFCKYALSGLHLMVVYFFHNMSESAVTIATNTPIAAFSLPSWVLNKIYPSSGAVVTWFKASDSAGTDHAFTLRKQTTEVRIQTDASLTIASGEYCRVLVDLLIDADY